MKAVIQRVKKSSVSVDGQTVGRIETGLLVFLGVASGDERAEVDYLVDKIVHLRIFEDANGKMNRSLLQVGGQLLVVSQFTLLADCSKGRRPSFSLAAPPEKARQLYRYFIRQAEARGVPTEQGRFGAFMDVELINDGPVTLLVETPS